jgi:hypothetical protein
VSDIKAHTIKIASHRSFDHTGFVSTMETTVVDVPIISLSTIWSAGDGFIEQVDWAPFHVALLLTLIKMKSYTLRRNIPCLKLDFEMSLPMSCYHSMQ